MCLQFVHPIRQAPHASMQAVKFLIPFLKAGLQIQDPSYSCKIDPFRSELLDQLQPIDIRLGIHTCIAAGPLRGNEPFLLIGPQGLRMNACKLSRYAYHVKRAILIAFSGYHGLTASGVAAKNSSIAFF